MRNYISINGQKIELTDEQVEKLKGGFNLPTTKLADIPTGETFKIGDYEFVVLEQSGDTTAIILKALYVKEQKFGANNNYGGSKADNACSKFADELETLVGKHNLCLHTVDLTADDGLKDYGAVKRKASLLTADKYRRFVQILDKHKLDAWWWLATPFSTKAHGIEYAVKCVAPSGYVDYCNCFSGVIRGVRPFCILKSNIFVSN